MAWIIFACTSGVNFDGRPAPSRSAIEHRRLAGEGFPALYGYVNVTRLYLHRIATTPQAFTGYECRAGAEEGVVDRRRVVVTDGALHALDRLLGAVPALDVLVPGNLPESRL